MNKDDFSLFNGILKFEYSHGRINAKELYNVNGFYFTCSPRPARMLSSDKLLFLTILDDYKNDAPRIIGRAKTHGFMNSNCANSAMTKKYNWTNHYKYFVELYDIEVIDAQISQGISLYKLIDDYINKTPTPKDAAKAMYIGTKAQNPYRAYAQQSYRMITNQVKDDINSRLEKSFQNFGKINL